MGSYLALTLIFFMAEQEEEGSETKIVPVF